MTDQELKDIRYLASVLKRVEWSGQDGSCPVCRRKKAYGMHPCSCVIRLGQKALARLLGEAVGGECDQPELQRYYVEDGGLEPATEPNFGDWVRWEDVLSLLEIDS